jgi:hypothetical protein
LRPSSVRSTCRRTAWRLRPLRKIASIQTRTPQLSSYSPLQETYPHGCESYLDTCLNSKRHEACTRRAGCVNSICLKIAGLWSCFVGAQAACCRVWAAHCMNTCARREPDRVAHRTRLVGGSVFRAGPFDPVAFAASCWLAAELRSRQQGPALGFVTTTRRIRTSRACRCKWRRCRIRPSNCRGSSWT